MRPLVAKAVAEFLVLPGDDRVKPAHVRGFGHESGQGRLVVDQQQPRQGHF